MTDTKQKLFSFRNYFIFRLLLFTQNSGIEKAFVFDVMSKIHMATDSSPVDMQSFELCCDMIDVVVDLSTIYRYLSHFLPVFISRPVITMNFVSFLLLLHSPEQVACIDEQSSSIFKLNNGIILYLRQICNGVKNNKFGFGLALVCILREYNFTRQGIIDYNFHCLRDAIHKLFAVNLPTKSGTFDFNQADDDDCDGGASGYINGNTDRPYEQDQLRNHSNAPLTNYLLTHKFHNKSEHDLN